MTPVLTGGGTLRPGRPSAEAAEPAPRELRCAVCGYGAVVRNAPARCPMCGARAWSPARSRRHTKRAAGPP